ncbi:hypothetical protein K435DRAFT_783709 [Dendrothele bispora CBS 962.96]|uniref:Uncharacterized protein n=1 Tax=Dendrothele bispora (strain CBS 962.96) TaxID=1314807 RepID=A0A4S8L7Q9_DENBC|nr:hypothetical protein K435DRAFT_783709 [Dendrothele bispora CBS 962.96]
MGYMNVAVVIQKGSKRQILLIPGETGRHEGCDFVPENFALYNPTNDTFMSWEEDCNNAPGIVGCSEIRIYPSPSPKHNKGISDGIVFAIYEKNGTGIKLYYYKPAENNGFRFFGTIKNTLVNTGQKSGAKRFIGFEAVGSDMYVLAKNEVDSLDTIIRVKFLGIDDS